MLIRTAWRLLLRRSGLNTCTDSVLVPLFLFIAVAGCCAVHVKVDAKNACLPRVVSVSESGLVD